MLRLLSSPNQEGGSFVMSKLQAYDAARPSPQTPFMAHPAMLGDVTNTCFLGTYDLYPAMRAGDAHRSSERDHQSSASCTEDLACKSCSAFISNACFTTSTAAPEEEPGL